MTDLSLARFRTCKRCGCTKPLDAAFFYRESPRPGGPNASGFRYGCKVCAQAARSAKRRANLEDHRAKERRWESQDHTKERRRAYRQLNRRIYREACRKWRESNPGKQSESVRNYIKANPHKKREFDRTYRARKMGAEHEPYTAADINAMWHEQGGLCYYCKVPVFGRYHIDHKTPLSRGGADALYNLCVSCPFCNNSKKDKNEAEYLAYMAARLPKGT